MKLIEKVFAFKFLIYKPSKGFRFSLLTITFEIERLYLNDMEHKITIVELIRQVKQFIGLSLEMKLNVQCSVLCL